MGVMKDGETALSNLKAGERGRINALLFAWRPVMRRLISIGLLPGEELIVERSSPEYLIRFGFTLLAINRTLARDIIVDKMTFTPGNR